MAPQRVQKRKSVATPTKSPAKRKTQITQSQKEALIDNLQLEITERARKMRAQYALQAQGLRTRLEIRVHRIPAALRKTSIADLLAKYSEQANVRPGSKELHSPVGRVQAKHIVAKSSSGKAEPPRGTKRKSDELEEQRQTTGTVQAEPKKRTRTADAPPAAANAMDGRPAARRVPPSQILSPKSINSRTLPQSSFKPTISPMKANAPRPTSPLKPSITAPTATSLAKTADKPAKPKAAGSRATSKQDKPATAHGPKQTRTKRAAAAVPPPRLVSDDSEDALRRASNISDAASSSAGTTIVRTTRKGPASAAAAAAAVKGKVAGTRAKFEGIAATGQKVAAPKTATAGPGGTVKGGRMLRKRA